VNPLYDWDKRLEGSIQLIEEDPRLAKHNKTRLLEFKWFLLVEKGLKPVRVVKYLYTLRIVLGWLGNISCTMADKEDLLCIVERIDSNGFKEWIRQHPGGGDPEAWVGINLNLPKSSKSITYAAFRQVLKTCAEKTGIKKISIPTFSDTAG
jgi:hypothetical protein